MLVIAVSNEKQTLRLEHLGTIEFGRGPQRAGVVPLHDRRRLRVCATTFTSKNCPPTGCVCRI